MSAFGQLLEDELRAARAAADKEDARPDLIPAPEPRLVRAVGYVRVSTKEQAISGLGLEAQVKAIEEECDRRGWLLASVEQDAGVSTRRAVMPGLERAIDACRGGEVSVLVVAKLDRLARSVGKFAAIVDLANKEGWDLVVLDPAVDLTTPMGRAMAGVAAVFAQLERDLISQRTKDGLAISRAKGILPGLRSTIDERTVKRIVREYGKGKSLRSIAEGLDLDCVPTPRGAYQWHHARVKDVLEREGVELRPRAESPTSLPSAAPQ